MKCSSCGRTLNDTEQSGFSLGLGPKCLAMGQSTMGYCVSSKEGSQALAKTLNGIRTPEDMAKEFNNPLLADGDPKEFHQNVEDFQTANSKGESLNPSPEELAELNKKKETDPEAYVDGFEKKTTNPNGLEEYDEAVFIANQLKSLDEVISKQQKDADLLKEMGVDINKITPENFAQVVGSLPDPDYLMKNKDQLGISHRGNLSKRLNEMVANAMALKENKNTQRIYKAENDLLTETDPEKIEKLHAVIDRYAEHSVDALLSAGVSEQAIIDESYDQEQAYQAQKYMRENPIIPNSKKLKANPQRQAQIKNIMKQKQSLSKGLAKFAFRGSVAVVYGIGTALLASMLGKQSGVRKSLLKSGKNMMKNWAVKGSFNPKVTHPKVLSPKNMSSFNDNAKANSQNQAKQASKHQIEAAQGKRVNAFKGTAALKVAKGTTGSWSKSQYKKDNYVIKSNEENLKAYGAAAESNIHPEKLAIVNSYNDTQKKEAKDAYLQMKRMGITDADLANVKNSTELRTKVKEQSASKVLGLSQKAAVDRHFHSIHAKAQEGQHLYYKEMKENKVKQSAEHKERVKVERATLRQVSKEAAKAERQKASQEKKAIAQKTREVEKLKKKTADLNKKIREKERKLKKKAKVKVKKPKAVKQVSEPVSQNQERASI